MVKKFGSLYEGVRTSSALPAIYIAVFCMRRLGMVLAIVFLKEKPVTMIYTYLAIFSLNWIYLVHARANED